MKLGSYSNFCSGVFFIATLCRVQRVHPHAAEALNELSNNNIANFTFWATSLFIRLTDFASPVLRLLLFIKV